MTSRGSSIDCKTVLIGPFYTRRQAARHAHLSNREILAVAGLIRLDAEFSVEEAYLAFQFDGGGIRPDLTETALHLEGRGLHPCCAADWLTRLHPDLGGKTPLEWLTAGGRLEAVLTLADTAEHRD